MKNVYKLRLNEMSFHRKKKGIIIRRRRSNEIGGETKVNNKKSYDNRFTKYSNIVFHLLSYIILCILLPSFCLRTTTIVRNRRSPLELSVYQTAIPDVP